MQISGSSKKIEIAALIGIVFVAMLWGLAFVVVKSSLDFVTPMYMLAYRFTVGGVVLGLIFLPRLIRAFKERGMKVLFRGTLIGFSLYLAEVTQTYGCKYTTAGKNAFLTTIYVILVPFLHWIFNKKKPQPKCLIAAVISFTGIGFISLTEQFTIQLGDFLTIVCGLFYALQIVLIARYAADEDPVVLTILQILAAAVMSWLTAIPVDGLEQLSVWETSMIRGILYLGLVSTMLCFLLQNVCQKYAPPGPCAILMGLESVFGVLFSVLFLSEKVTSRMFFGCVLMFIAIVIIEVTWKDPFRNLYPTRRIESAYDVDYEQLYADGIRGIIYDIDNTLVEHGFPADERAVALMERLRNIGFAVLFLSNNKEPRVKSFQEKAAPWGSYLYKAGKPSSKGYKSAMEIMHTDTKSTILIGDQLFTDVWGANNVGIESILVKPIHPKEEIQIVLKRRLEAIVLFFYDRKVKREAHNEDSCNERTEY